MDRHRKTMKNFVSCQYALITITATVVLCFPSACTCSPSTNLHGGGQWELLQASIGISPMHMQLLPDGNVMMFDRIDYGPSNLTSADGHTTSHSLLYNSTGNTFRPLLLLTDAWCSSGSLSPGGSLVQTGGFNNGDRAIRTFTPCPPSRTHLCDWNEHPGYLSNRRWYSTNQILPDGRIIIVGGRRVYTYEFFPKSSNSAFSLPFLQETRDYPDENNLYPFLHLLPDGTLFIFANRRSISFDYIRNRIVREFPPIPHEKRNYPSSGSSVLLPLRLSNNNGSLIEAEIMVCGGATNGAYASSTRGVYLRASSTCGRLRVTDPNPEWVIFKMPMPRVMSDMLLLPTGDVLIINGAMNGTAGWEAADNPAKVPLLYSTGSHRFVRLTASVTPRMYHSAAVVLEDGRVLVGGSNPHKTYNFTAEKFPTELSLEAYWPEYMDARYDWLRPTILSVGVLRGGVSYGEIIPVTFWLPNWRTEDVKVTMMAPPFCTHSFGMNQRLLVVDKLDVVTLSPFTYEIAVRSPIASSVAPPGYYLMFVVNSGIPSTGADCCRLPVSGCRLQTVADCCRFVVAGCFQLTVTVYRLLAVAGYWLLPVTGYRLPVIGCCRSPVTGYHWLPVGGCRFPVADSRLLSVAGCRFPIVSCWRLPVAGGYRLMPVAGCWLSVTGSVSPEQVQFGKSTIRFRVNRFQNR